MPHIKGAPAAAAGTLKAGFEGIGWDVRSNVPAAGSTGPPTPDALLAFLAGSFAALRPPLQAARAAAAAAAKALAEEQRELAFAEEDAGEGGDFGADPSPLDRRNPRGHGGASGRGPSLRAQQQQPLLRLDYLPCAGRALC